MGLGTWWEGCRPSVLIGMIICVGAQGADEQFGRQSSERLRGTLVEML